MHRYSLKTQAHEVYRGSFNPKLNTVNVFICSLIAILVFISSCNLFSRSSKPEPEVIVDKDCIFGVKLFNEQTSQNVIGDIAKILRSGNQSRIDELTALYPDFSAAWNSTIRDIKRNYSSTYRVGGFPTLTTAELANPRATTIPAPSKFYLMLYSFLKGPYPSGSLDMEKLTAYKERGDLSIFINTMLRVKLQENCRTVSSEQVRAAMRPAELPANIADCLKNQQ